MKKVSLILILIAVYTTSTAQEIQTIFSNDNAKEKSFGGYGGPLIRASSINQDWGVMMGGKGGFIINRTIAFGGLGMALLSQPEFDGDNLSGDQNAALYLEYASGGVFFEYFFNLEKPVHFSIPLNLMGGGATVRDKESNQEIESSGLFAIEPGLGIEFNVSQHFIPALNVTYRQALGSNLSNLDNQQLSGLNIELVFKIGAF